jgi:hypothetical protein
MFDGCLTLRLNLPATRPGQVIEHPLPTGRGDALASGTARSLVVLTSTRDHAVAVLVPGTLSSKIAIYSWSIDLQKRIMRRLAHTPHART